MSDPLLHDDDFLDLDAYQFKLLAYYRRECQRRGGVCDEPIRATAAGTRMSNDKAWKTRRQLVALERITLHPDNTVTLVERVRPADTPAEYIRVTDTADERVRMTDRSPVAATAVRPADTPAEYIRVTDTADERVRNTDTPESGGLAASEQSFDGLEIERVRNTDTADERVRMTDTQKILKDTPPLLKTPESGGRNFARAGARASPPDPDLPDWMNAQQRRAVARGLGVEVDKSAEAAAHPLVIAYRAEFPEDARPDVPGSWLDAIPKLEAKRATVAEVAALTAEKLAAGRGDYRFPFLVTDLDEWRGKQAARPALDPDLAAAWEPVRVRVARLLAPPAQQYLRRAWLARRSGGALVFEAADEAAKRGFVSEVAFAVKQQWQLARRETVTVEVVLPGERTAAERYAGGEFAAYIEH